MSQSQTAICEAREAYRMYGYCILRNLLAPSLCDEIVKAAHHIADAAGAGYRPLMQPHRIDAIFLRMAAHPDIVSYMHDFMGGPVQGLQTEFFFNRPGTAGFAAHQDNSFVEAPPGQFASAWAALTEVTEENGCLWLYPGTQREPILQTEEFDNSQLVDQDPNARRRRTVVPAGYDAVPAPLSKGDVVMFDGHTVHHSGDNHSTGWRYAMLTTYIRQGAHFRPGRYANRQPFDVE